MDREDVASSEKLKANGYIWLRAASSADSGEAVPMIIELRRIADSGKTMKEIITNLNKTFDNRTRLGIMSLLLVDDWVEFKRLKEMLGLTDGNLASHLKGLETKKYIKLKKQFVGRKPMTTYACTTSGRKAFEEHLDALEKLLQKRK